MRYEVEQFAYPLHGPPSERRGDMPMVLLQQLTVTELRGTPRDAAGLDDPSAPAAAVRRRHDRRRSAQGDAMLFRERGRARRAARASRARRRAAVERHVGLPAQPQQKRIDATVFVDLPANGTRQFVVKLPSPMVPDADVAALTAIDYADARAATLEFWSEYVARGAQFRVPEPAVNDLFRASLWHALRLPRRHGGAGADVAIDLPYSNFAYSQTGTPWPVNQAVYVDYMLYDLRGYHAIADRGARRRSSATTRRPTGTSAATPTGSSTRRRCSTRSRRTTCSRRIARRSSGCCRRR